MRRILTYTTLLFALFINACNNGANPLQRDTMPTKDSLHFRSGHAQVNGMSMYYEIYGEGKPLVLIHGGGSTIQTTFGRVIPALARHYQLVCVELQAHGRSGDRPGAISFEQDADDVAALLQYLHIAKAAIFGFSNGGNTALQIAIRHPQLCNKIIAGSILLKRSGALPAFWSFMNNGTFEQMPQVYKETFLQLNNNDSSRLLNMFHKCADRMKNFRDFSDEAIRSVTCPVLLINGNADVATPEHAVAMSKLLPHCTLLILPGGHGEYIGEITTWKPGDKKYAPVIDMIIQFLESSEDTVPL